MKDRPRTITTLAIPVEGAALAGVTRSPCAGPRTAESAAQRQGELQGRSGRASLGRVLHELGITVTLTYGDGHASP